MKRAAGRITWAVALGAMTFATSCREPAAGVEAVETEEVAATDGELAPPGEELLGVWRLEESSLATAKPDGWIEITPTHWVVAAEGRLQYRSPLHGVAGDELILSSFGNRQRRRLELAGDELVVRYTQTRTRFRPDPEDVVERYRRARDRPAALTLETVALGDPDEPAAERVAAIRDELAERGRRDQEVREIFATPGARPSPEDQERMRQTDEDNTAYLLRLIAEVGWIDGERFGEEAAESAWLIVQHSPDLRLKWTVLSELEERRRATGEADGRFALLWDRTRIWLGGRQRYGSQLFYGPEGMFVPPLEDPERVDELRAEVGLGPLADYLARFTERNDGQPVPVLEEY